MSHVDLSFTLMMLVLTLLLGLIMPLNHVFADTVKMKARVMCLDPSTGKYKVSITLVGYYTPEAGFTPIKHGEKQTKTVDLGKIAKNTGDNQHIVSFKFKHVKIGYNYQAQSKSLKKDFSFRETIGYEEHGQDMLFPLDTHTCQLDN